MPSIAPGYWKGGANQFYVTPDSANLKKFSVRINVAGCGYVSGGPWTWNVTWLDQAGGAAQARAATPCGWPGRSGVGMAAGGLSPRDQSSCSSPCGVIVIIPSAPGIMDAGRATGAAAGRGWFAAHGVAKSGWA